jgi:YfiH family protein
VLLRSGVLAAARFAVTDRLGGVSAAPYDALNLADHVGDAPPAVAENRDRLAAALGLPSTQVVYMSQVHGADVAVVEASPGDGDAAPVADAMVTDRPGLALAVLTADCVPVLLADGGGRVGVAHAGRKGVARDVVGAVVAALGRLGAEPADLSALVGPAVCGACYEVPEAMRAEVGASVPAARAETRDGTPSLDLPAAVESQLRRCGVPTVGRVAACTAETPALFSYRRDRATGRFAGVLWGPA